MQVMIVGGGIGGCALALSLHAAGIVDVDVFESATEVRELGVGINVLPHAVRELTELGLLEALDARASRTTELAYYNRHGQRIYAEPRGIAAGYLWPQLSIHRGALLAVLHEAVLERLGAAHFHAGHHLAAFDADASGVAAVFDHPRSGDRRAEARADLLVGCDGVHSVVRAQLHPDEGPPLWNGVTMWRGTAVHSPFLTGRTMAMAGHIRRRVVIYPIQDLDDGLQLVNWVAEVKVADDQPMPRQDWEHQADLGDVLAHFSSFTFDWLDVPQLMAAAGPILQYPMVDRDPLATWDHDRVTLLGDAAHPMYPVGSNGASQAILDARVLARSLALEPTVGAAVAAYDAERRPATSAVVLANRAVGPERCMEIVEKRAPDGFEDIHDILGDEELAELSNAYRRMAGFDPATLNERPSLSVLRSGA